MQQQHLLFTLPRPCASTWAEGTISANESPLLFPSAFSEEAGGSQNNFSYNCTRYRDFQTLEWLLLYFINCIPLPAYKLPVLLYLSFQHWLYSSHWNENGKIGGGTNTVFQGRFSCSQDFVPNSFLVSEALKCWAFKPVNCKNNLLVRSAQEEVCPAGLFLHILSGRERCPPTVTSSFGFWGDSA